MENAARVTASAVVVIASLSLIFLDARKEASRSNSLGEERREDEEERQGLQLANSREHKYGAGGGWRNFLRSVVVLSIVLVYAFVCDRSGLVGSNAKQFLPTVAQGGLALGIMLYVCTFRENEGRQEGLLNNQMTDEWKGWMQIFLLFYHYLFPTPQPLSIYISARIVVACFLFQAGYGRTMSAMKRPLKFDPFLLFSILLRLNLLVVCITICMGRSYADYYFAPLISFWTLFFYCLHTLGAYYCPRTRVLFAAVVCAALSYNSERDPDRFSLARIVFAPFSFLLSSKVTPFDTWLFRSQLDTFSPLMGAIVALNHQQLQIWAANIHGLAPMKRTCAYGLVVAFGCVCMTLWALALTHVWSVASSRADACAGDCNRCKQCKMCGGAEGIQCMALRFAQEEYNYNHHPLLCAVPSLFYVILRNLTPTLRSHSSTLFAFLGTRSLELYVLQYHVWLASDAKRILSPFPGAPDLNALIVFPLFLLASDVAARSCAGMLAFILSPSEGLPLLWHKKALG